MDEEFGSASGSASDDEHTQSSLLQPLKKKVVRHSSEQVNRLKYYYEMGMRGCSKEDSVLIEKAASETRLTAEQVKVCLVLLFFNCIAIDPISLLHLCLLKRWVKKRNYVRSHTSAKADPTLPPLKKMKLTPWQVFQKEYGESDGMYAIHNFCFLVR